jgi:hypothetical protein
VASYRVRVEAGYYESHKETHPSGLTRDVYTFMVTLFKWFDLPFVPRKGDSLTFSPKGSFDDEEEDVTGVVYVAPLDVFHVKVKAIRGDRLQKWVKQSCESGWLPLSGIEHGEKSAAESHRDMDGEVWAVRHEGVIRVYTPDEYQCILWAGVPHEVIIPRKADGE